MVKVGIVGATGYGGRELIRLLGAHPESRLTAVLERGPFKIAVAASMLLYVALFATSSNQAFIYFQF